MSATNRGRSNIIGARASVTISVSSKKYLIVSLATFFASNDVWDVAPSISVSSTGTISDNISPDPGIRIVEFTDAGTVTATAINNYSWSIIIYAIPFY